MACRTRPWKYLEIFGGDNVDAARRKRSEHNANGTDAGNATEAIFVMTVMVAVAVVMMIQL